jgi:hypothetical protein
MNYYSTRRKVIRTLGVVSAASLAGCASDESSDESSGGEPDTQETTVEPTATDTTTAQQTQAEESERSSPPEARFVVAKDGSGDYETVEAAKRVAEPNDVIKIKSGEYELTIEQQDDPDYKIKKPLTLVGDGRNATTVAIDNGETSDGSITLNDDQPYSFWNLTAVQSGDDTLHFKTDAEIALYNTSFGIPVTGWKDGRRGEFVAYDSVINVPDDVARRYEESSFEIAKALVVTVGAMTVENCTVNSQIRISDGNATVVDTEFTARPEIQGGTIQNCTFREGVSVEGLTGSQVQISGCEFFADNQEFAYEPIELDSSGNDEDEGVELTRNVFHAPVRLNRTVKSLEFSRFEGADAEYYIDGKGARRIVGNGFMDGDIRINELEPEFGDEFDDKPTIYDDEEEIGNYYSQFSKDDSDGDGVIDLPKPIDGNAELTDQFPLTEDKFVSLYESN